MAGGLASDNFDGQSGCVFYGGKRVATANVRASEGANGRVPVSATSLQVRFPVIESQVFFKHLDRLRAGDDLAGPMPLALHFDDGRKLSARRLGRVVAHEARTPVDELWFGLRLAFE